MEKIKVELVRADGGERGAIHAFVLQPDGRGGMKRGSNLISRQCSNIGTAKERAAETVRKAYKLINMPEIDWIMPAGEVER